MAQITDTNQNKSLNIQKHILFANLDLNQQFQTRNISGTYVESPYLKGPAFS